MIYFDFFLVFLILSSSYGVSCLGNFPFPALFIISYLSFFSESKFLVGVVFVCFLFCGCNFDLFPIFYPLVFLNSLFGRLFLMLFMFLILMVFFLFMCSPLL